MELNKQGVDITQLDVENLSEKDRLLLKEVADSNTKVLIQLKKNKIASASFIENTYEKLRELVSMLVIAGSAMWAFHSLPPDMKNKAAQRYVDMAVPVVIAAGGAGAMIKGSRDRTERNSEVSAELEELHALEDKNKG